MLNNIVRRHSQSLWVKNVSARPLHTSISAHNRTWIFGRVCLHILFRQHWYRIGHIVSCYFLNYIGYGVIDAVRYISLDQCLFTSLDLRSHGVTVYIIVYDHFVICTITRTMIVASICTFYFCWSKYLLYLNIKDLTYLKILCWWRKCGSSRVPFLFFFNIWDLHVKNNKQMRVEHCSTISTCEL